MTRFGALRRHASLAVLGLALALVACAETPAPREWTEPLQVSETPKGAFEASVAVLDEHRAVVGWYDTRHESAEIYARVVFSDGRSGRELRLTSSFANSFEPSLAALGGDVVVAWYEQAKGQHDGTASAVPKRSVWVGRWSAAGEPRWRRELGRGRNPAVVATEGNLFVGWIAETGAVPTVEGRWLDDKGESVGVALEIAPASVSTWNLNATAAGAGGVLLAFDAPISTAAPEIHVARIEGPTLLWVRRVTSDDGAPSLYPDVAVRDDRVGLTWFDERDGNAEIYWSAVDGVDGLDEDSVETEARRVTHTPAPSIGAYAAMGPAGPFVAWSEPMGGAHEIHLASMASAATSRRQLTDNPTDSLIPAIEDWGGAFFVAWNELEASLSSPHSSDARSQIVVQRVVGDG